MDIRMKVLLTGIFLIAALLLAWQLSSILLLAFAGILVAALLDAAARPLSRLFPIPRPVLIIAIALAIAGLIIASLSLGGASLWQSADELWDMLSAQVLRLYEAGQSMGIGESLNIDQETIQSWIPGPAGLFDQASSLFGSTLGLMGNVVVVAFLGLFLAISPKSYRDGFLLLIPPAKRADIRQALDKTGSALRGWLITQLLVMVLIGVLVFALLWALGSPYALLLGLLAGGLNFIPYLGPVISSIPVLLTLASADMTIFWLGAAGLLIIQNLEGYVITPLLQQRFIKLQPAWSLLVMAIMGSLFGPLGVALATPLFAVCRTLVFALYIKPQEQGVSPSRA